MTGATDLKSAIPELFELCKNKGSLDRIESLLRCFPAAAKAKDYRGYHPLHYACERDATVQVIQAVLEACPDAVNVQDSGKSRNDFRQLPLHLAGNCAVDVIQMLVKASPQSVKVKDAKGMLPVHYAATGGHLPAVSCLVQAWPESVQVQSNDGSLPLLLACKAIAPLETILFLLNSWPDAAKVPDQQNRLALHAACAKNAPATAIQKILEAWPDAVKVSVQDFSQKLALHYACDGDASLEVIQPLLSSWPDSIRVQDKYGNLPLHYSIRHFPVARFLVESWPESVRVRNGRGEIPLDLACRKSTKDETPSRAAILELLSKEEEDDDDDEQRRRSLPLHFACQFSSSLETLKRLVYIWPQAVSQQAPNGMLPLQCACDRHEKLSLKAMQFLFHRYPMALQKPCADTGDLPLHQVCQQDACVSLVRWMIEMFPTALRTRNRNGEVPLHLACITQRLPVIKALVEPNPDTVLVANGQGDLPLHCLCQIHGADVSLPVLKYLIQKEYPEPPSRASGSTGDLPLHSICRPGVDPATLQYLVGQYGEALRIPSGSTGELPLHYFCRFSDHRGQRSIIQYLIARSPNALQVPSGLSGDLPLHSACRNQLHPTILQSMAIKYPPAVGIISSNGDLPLHDICRHYSHSLATVQFFLRRHPSAIGFPSVNSRNLPLHLACLSGAPLDVVAYLVKEQPSAVHAVTAEGWLPLHLVCKSGHASLDVLFFLLCMTPEALRLHGGKV